MKTITINKTVKQSVQEFYTTNNFGEDGGIYERFVWVKFGFLSFPMLNFKNRKENVIFHDINHVITGYATNWKGESAVLVVYSILNFFS